MMYVCIKIYIQGMKSFALKSLINNKNHHNHLTREKVSKEGKKVNEQTKMLQDKS